MKRYVFLLAAMVIAVSACRKDHNVSPGLFGKWELRRVYGGFAYFDSTYKAGNGNIYQFGSDSTYKLFIKNKLNAQGMFNVVKLIYGGSVSSGIVFNYTENPEPFVFTGTKITIGTSNDDGIASEYQKISN
ncbi:MAG TPA: hypothetical protein VHB54_07430 [Mucilaginibacter sp.]|nr:hypothetical protein [Mucilaginibacter sp.]